MKKILPVAVLAALAGVNGAQAVHVNPDGLGQVLLYPFYTTEADQDTYINLVNTTDEYKAVKIRILESMNSVEVLDFNIYMSPFDHWSAVITEHADGGASLQTADKTCTVPIAVSQGIEIPFRSTEYQADSEDGIDRTREGYVEVIEMGTIQDTDGLWSAIEHVDGVPGDCAELTARWNTGGAWDLDSSDGMTSVSGGLYGYGVLIDVPRGTDATYDAVALDDFADFSVNHTDPGSLLPSLESSTTDYDLFDQGGVVSGSAITDGVDAVSAILMSSSISNDYVLEPSIGGGTDWVVTFPTKRAYVNESVTAIPPFTDIWDAETSTACETFEIRYWDREEGEPTTPVSPLDFSPLPPPGEIPTFSFCHEANVLTYNDSNVLSASDRTGVNLNLEEGFDNGWARIDFTGTGRVLTTQDHQFLGLPQIGFAVQRYINAEVEGAQTLANYAGTVTHKADRSIVFP